ncbi:hypothetical protein PT276_02715 [Orbaceae bacterium ESL0721]|nr:hypothetical protein [Orbaceae bacterium ESL0721]
MSKTMIPLDNVDLITEKLQQARSITLLIQGNNSTDAPLTDVYIDYALSAVADLLKASHAVLTGGHNE